MKLGGLGKKADLSLSINAIVVLILAITMLGLGLLFIRNQFGGGSSKLATMTEQIDAGEPSQQDHYVEFHPCSRMPMKWRPSSHKATPAECRPGS